MISEGGIPVKMLPEAVEKQNRTGEEGSYDFYLNCTTEPVTIPDVRGVNLETGESLSGKLELPAYGVAVLLQTE